MENLEGIVSVDENKTYPVKKGSKEKPKETLECFYKIDFDKRYGKYRIYEAIRCLNLGKFFGDASGTIKKKAIREFHDVRLMDRRDFFTPLFHRILKRKLGNSERGFSRNHLDRLNHPRRHDMFDAGVEILGVFTKDHEVNILVE